MLVRRRTRFVASVVAALLAAVMVFPAVAQADLDGPIGGLSQTNPDADGKAWRQRWGKSVNPHFEFTQPEMDGMLYWIDRSPFTSIDASTPALYYRDVRQAGAHLSSTLDILGILDYNAAWDGLLVYPGKAKQPVEGKWYFHLRPFDVDASTLRHTYSSSTKTFDFGIDRTAPGQVTGVAPYASMIAPTPATGWLKQSRAHIKWDYKDYDLLAGTAYFRVYIDGTLEIPSTTDPTDGEGVPWYGAGGTGSVTIEDFAPGRHTIQVQAVDRATNAGPLSAAAVVQIDPGTPTVTILNPTASGARLGVKPTIKALATDDAGVDTVKVLIDGTQKALFDPAGTPTSYTASRAIDLSSFASGTHTLDVKAQDMYGRVVSKTVSFVLDKTAPVLSLRSAGPTPFYPRKRDGYRDNFVVKFSASEAATAKLVVKDSSGTTWRTISKSVPSGASSIAWNGKSNSGSMKQGTFRWYLQLTDKAGNKSTVKAGRTSIRYYQVVQTSSDTVKIIQR